MQKTLIAGAVALLMASPLVATTSADARQFKKSSTVTACSTTGFDCYTAPVVKSRVGKKLVLRNGTRIDCGPSCRDTLRKETVDFWFDRMLNGS